MTDKDWRPEIGANCYLMDKQGRVGRSIYQGETRVSWLTGHHRCPYKHPKREYTLLGEAEGGHREECCRWVYKHYGNIRSLMGRLDATPESYEKLRKIAEILGYEEGK